MSAEHNPGDLLEEKNYGELCWFSIRPSDTDFSRRTTTTRDEDTLETAQQCLSTATHHDTGKVLNPIDLYTDNHIWRDFSNEGHQLNTVQAFVSQRSNHTFDECGMTNSGAPWSLVTEEGNTVNHCIDADKTTDISNKSYMIDSQSGGRGSALDRLDDEEKKILKDLFCAGSSSYHGIISSLDNTKRCLEENQEEQSHPKGIFSVSQNTSNSTWPTVSGISMLFESSTQPHNEEVLVPKHCTQTTSFVSTSSTTTRLLGGNNRPIVKQEDVVYPLSWARAILMRGLRDLMRKSKQSQDRIQSWEEKQGLPRSHCVTMMHTNRSRRQLLEGKILPKWNGRPLIAGGKTKKIGRAIPKSGPAVGSKKTPSFHKKKLRKPASKTPSIPIPTNEAHL